VISHIWLTNIAWLIRKLNELHFASKSYNYNNSVPVNLNNSH